MSATHIVAQSKCLFATKSEYSDYSFSVKPPMYKTFHVVCMSEPISIDTKLIYAVNKNSGVLTQVHVYTEELDDSMNSPDEFVYTTEVTWECVLEE